MKKRIIINLIILLFVNISGFAQSYYKVSCPNLNGDEGKDYALDTINFKAYLVSETASTWKIYKVDLLSGTSTTLNISANGPINSLYYRNDSLYFGGTFTAVNSNTLSYKYFAVYNTTTNALQPGMNTQLNAAVTGISIHKNKLFLTGHFTSVFSTSRRNIVGFSFASSPLNAASISTVVAYPSDLTNYLINNTLTPISITNMKTYGDYLFFIIDGHYLYNFAPYPTGSTLPTHKFSEGGDLYSKIYDYDLIGQNVYVAGNFAMNQTGLDIGNLNYNTSLATDYDKVTFYNLYNGTFPGYFNNLWTLFPLTSNYVPLMDKGIEFGCTGFRFKNNRFNFVLNRADYPVTDRNTIINTDAAITNFSQITYTSTTWGNSGTFGATDYYTINNVKSFSNILSSMASNIGFHGGNYYPLNLNDSLMITRTGNAAVNGFSQSYGAFCKGDTITLKLNKQGNLHGHVWYYSGTGMSILSANSDSAKVVFNYGASPGNIKIYAYDNFNFKTDTFSYPVTFKPIPNVSAGSNKYITCKNSTVKLKATTSLTNYNIDWITPTGFTTLDSLTAVSAPGTYYSRIKNNLTGCYGYDTISVILDVVKPNLSFPVTNNYTLTCNQSTQTITANASNLIDTVYWTGALKYVSTSSIVVTSAGKKYVNCIGNFNGCKKTDSVIVFQNVVLPALSNNVTKDSLTCIRDSVFLNGSSTSGNILFWRRPGFPATDSIPNPIYTKLTGFHSLVVRNTSTGCKSSLLVNVSNSKLQPYVAVPSHSATITCSQSFINLTGSSATPGATLNWQGPSAFSAANPAAVSVIGIYTITATDPTNGCSKSDTVVVTKQNSLLLQSSNDTAICNGSNVTIYSNPAGGTLPYTYNWQGFGATSQINVNPADTAKYIITITDAAGCVGKDTITVNVPKSLSDSTTTFQPCDPNNPNGQIQIYPKGGTAPFLFSLNGSAYQSSNIFTNLSFGTYNLSIKDAIGCVKNASTQINDASLAPQNDFLVSTNLYKVDTFVVVDISNPKPDSVHWTFPATFTVINITNQYAPVVICSDTGFYSIQQTAYFGGCTPVLTKTVHIKYNDGSFATAYNNNGIQSVSLSPNPNNGEFNLNVSMFKKQTFTIFVNDATGVEKHRLTVNDSDNFTGNIIVPQVANGIYVLKVVSAYDSKHILFIVTQ